mmetsp:Transcript_4052/g.4479  ORF Transcript_4052/g.4479 Transcript_4052/m.4479 type:complete len:105 (-) Transcript_4052:802-1116(-)
MTVVSLSEPHNKQNAPKCHSVRFLSSSSTKKLRPGNTGKEKFAYSDLVAFLILPDDFTLTIFISPSCLFFSFLSLQEVYFQSVQHSQSISSGSTISEMIFGLLL